MKKFLEKIVTGVITCSGFLSSFIILLIVIFLFSEGFGLFSQKTIEDGYSLLVNKENPVNELDAKQIKEIFDEDVTNWKQVEGNDEAITLVRFDDLPKLFSPSQLGENYERAGICIDSLVNSNKGIIAFMPSSFVEKEFTGKKLSDHKISVKEVRVVPYGNACATVRLRAVGSRHRVGYGFCDIVRPAIRPGGVNIHV